jgi:pyruvate kinase
MDIRTKIICTIGPSIAHEEQIISLIQAGMNVARVNFSHGTHSEHTASIELLKKVRKKLKIPFSIMVDTKGPEIRLGQVPEEGITVKAGDRLRLIKEEKLGTHEEITIRPSIIIDHLTVGCHLLIDNGYIQAHVIGVDHEGVEIEFINEGTIYSSKGVNVPNSNIPLPAVTEKDVTDLQLSAKLGVDLIAASFIRTAEHVLEIKKLLHQFSNPNILVIAKIENNQGIQNFESILQVADGIMVARGDLGVEIPLSKVPRLQKMMIRKSNLIGKPVVTATQMLESMILNPRPTRAEVSDVANAIYDGTSAVMLSGETAVGKYPFETVSIMKSIIQEAEQDFDYQIFFEMHNKMRYQDISSALTLASVKTAYSLGAKAIFTFSQSGTTARLLSRLKPQMPIIAITSHELTYHQLALSWGVEPVLCPEQYSTMEDALAYARNWALERGIVSYGDLIVVTTGAPFWIPGSSNTLLVESIGNVLAKGAVGIGTRIHGLVSLLPSAVNTKPASLLGKIVALTSFDDSFIPLIQDAAGAILQNSIEDLESEKRLLDFCKKSRKTAIVRVEDAFRVLREGQLITLDPDRAIIFKDVLEKKNAT